MAWTTADLKGYRWAAPKDGRKAAHSGENWESRKVSRTAGCSVHRMAVPSADSKAERWAGSTDGYWAVPTAKNLVAQKDAR